ncbi:ankyrin repeat domain-containing protein [Nodularia chucula]|uniref:ankyrin repeat domain-containing protein n=1 Tax=Nodularia chucula TaxID=3093667 RepID=UPI0039C5B815
MQIHIYAEEGNIAKVQQEIAHGVDINYLDKYESRTPLMFAVSSPHADIDLVRLLVENGADVNAVDTYQNTVLALAVQSGNLEKIQFLLDAGADINYQKPHGYDVLIDAMYGRDITKDENLLAIIDLLIKRGAKVTGVTDSGESALRRASDTGRFDAVKILLAAGADPQQLIWTELMHAIVFGSLADVEKLITQGDELFEIDYYGRNPWLLSLQVGDLAKAELLLGEANCHEFEYGGKTSLMYAIENNRFQILQWLIDKGCDVEATDEFGTTALMVAVERDHPECVKILLEAGAKANRENNYHEKVIQQTNNIEIVRMLLAVGEDINNVNDEMLRLLMGVSKNDILHISKSQYLAGKHRRFGKSNPELMEVDFWKAMVSSGFRAYKAQQTFNDTNYHESHQPVWCFDRFGRTVTQLPDGKIVVIAGEHEDYYDPNFCIYNDVVVSQGDGNFQIYGYSEDVFPPTDFHSATLVGKYIYIIGSLGYLNERICDHTPVYRLHCETFTIDTVKTSGENPGWIYKHTAYYQEPNQICISGGKILAIVNQKQQWLTNANSYTLDLKKFRWTRIISSDTA